MFGPSIEAVYPRIGAHPGRDGLAIRQGARLEGERICQSVLYKGRMQPEGGTALKGVALI